jgi:type II secretory pathway component PulJ
MFKRRPPSFSILASMLSGVLPTGKFEGRQQLRSDPACVAVFADHPPPPKLEGITEEVEVDEYTESE